MNSGNVVLWAVPFYVIVVLLEVIASSVKNLKLFNFKESLSNIACGVAQQVFDVVINLAVIPLYLILREHGSFFKLEASFTNIVLLFLVKDFIYYWSHRLSHNVNCLWALHLVHHQSKVYNTTVGLRMPMFHYLFDVVQIAIIALLGFHIENFVLVSVIWASIQILSHTTFVKNEIPVFSKIFVTPSHHRVHHGHNQIYRNKNYGGIFSFWDRLFGSYQPELKEEPIQFGVDDDSYSANPVRANTLYWGHLFNQMKKEKSLGAKIGVLFARPSTLKDKRLSLSKKTKNNNLIISASIFLLVGSSLFIGIGKNAPLYLSSVLALILLGLFYQYGKSLEE